MTIALHVQLLGDFRLAYSNTPVNTVSTSRLKSILAYLLLHYDAPQSRQHLAFLFWPDTADEQARANLRNLIYFLKRALPDSENYLLVETQTIQWNPEASFILDVDNFTRLAGRNASLKDLLQAIDLYRGDLLPECYDDWIQLEREHLRETYINALDRLVQQLEAERDYPRAIAYARRLLQVDPLQEEAYRQLMRLLAAVGERAKALHVYHSCATVLERELGVEPGHAIQMVYQRLLKAESPPHVQRLPGTPSLIGRQREWALLKSAWRNTIPGQAHFTLMTGEAGIGKTRLAEEMIEWAERQGIGTARAYCFATEGTLSYAPVTAWLRSRPLPALEELWLCEMTRLLPELLVEHPELSSPPPLTENWQRVRLFQALGFAILNEQSELILLIEDIQWSDRDTIEWIAYLMQAQPKIAPETRLFVIGTLLAGGMIDNQPLETLLADLRHSERITEIELESLNETETIALAGAVIGEEVNPAFRSRLFEETEGNPLFIVETVREGMSDARVWAAGPGHEMANLLPSLPEKVRQIVEARLLRLSPTAQELACLASVAGREFSYKILSLASNFGEEALMRALDELWRRRIIRERGMDAYDFSHEKIRLVTYEQMSATRRRFCHLKVAETLEKLHTNDLGSVSPQLAAHYEQAGLIEKAILYYQLAAQVAQRLFANQQTVQFLQRGMKLLEGEGSFELPARWVEEKHGQLLELQGDILARIGNYDEACSSHQRAMTRVGEIDSFWQARLQRKLGNDFREQFYYDQAVVAYRMAQESIGQPPQENAGAWWGEWIELQLDQSLVYFYLSRLDDVVRLVERLGPMIEQYGTIPQRGRYYRRLVTIKFRQERFVVDDETVYLSRKALATIKESDDLVEVASAYFGLGLALIWYGELNEAEEQIQAAVEVTKQTGQDLLPVCFAYLAVVYRKRGDIGTALEYARQVLEITSLKKSPIYFAMAKSTFAWAAWRQKRQLEAEEQARQALAIWQDLPDAFPFRWVALWPLIGSALAQDHLPEAINAAQALFGPYQQPPPPALAASLNAAIQAWEDSQSTDACLLLNQAIGLAANSGYL